MNIVNPYDKIILTDDKLVAIVNNLIKNTNGINFKNVTISEDIPGEHIITIEYVDSETYPAKEIVLKDATQLQKIIVNASEEYNDNPNGELTDDGKTLVLNLPNVKGDTGAQGPRGETGPTGLKGDTIVAATASITDIGDGQVDVAISGEGNEKTLDFTFSNITCDVKLVDDLTYEVLTTS